MACSRYSKKASKAVAERIIWRLVDVPAQRYNVYPEVSWLGRSCPTERWKVLEGFESTLDLICFSRFTLHIVVWRGAQIEVINRLLPYM